MPNELREKQGPTGELGKDVEFGRGGIGPTAVVRGGINMFSAGTPVEGQIGGTHYRHLDPSPFDVVRAWGLSHAEGEILYHLIRHRLKYGKTDLLKCIHWIELIMQHDYPDLGEPASEE